jgi:hypothetical protein
MGGNYMRTVWLRKVCMQSRGSYSVVAVTGVCSLMMSVVETWPIASSTVCQHTHKPWPWRHFVHQV